MIAASLRLQTSAGQSALRRAFNPGRRFQLIRRRCYASGSSLPGLTWRNTIAVSAIATAVGTILVAARSRVELAKPVPPPSSPAITSSEKTEPVYISFEELEQHNTKESCWIMVRDKVYDVTEFLPLHPGGPDIIIGNAGIDATAIFERLHPPGVLEAMTKPEWFLGVVDPGTLKVPEAVLNDDGVPVDEARKRVPPIDYMINFDDFEEIAKSVLPKVAWSYYASAADTEKAFKGNLDAFSRYWFRPRVLRKVKSIDMSTKILGMPTALPIFACPAGLAKLGHPNGEVNITRAAGATGILQAVPVWSSCTLEEIAAARLPGQNVLMQLYVNSDHSITEPTMRKIAALGYKAILLTVDTPVSGKRTKDLKARGGPLVRGRDGKPVRSGIAGSGGRVLDADLNWDDLPWIREITKLPIIVKGVQSVEDVELAEKYGADGVLLSNHGGRQLDYAPASIDILYELRQRRPDILDNKKMEIYCDGGFRRGTDVLKALCLGATAVGMGRPMLYANAAYGEEGIVKFIDILQEEIATGMRLLGVTKIEELGPHLVRRINEVAR